MAKILITGGSGLVGTALIKQLLKGTHQVSVLSRKQVPDSNYFLWNLEDNYIEEGALENVDIIIHLAGANIAEKRWTKRRKRELINSRVLSTRLLHTYCQRKNIKLKGFISTSAIGYYGALTEDTTFKESDSAGNDFLAKLCALWESEAIHFSSLADRVVIIRSGIILSKYGGAFEKILKPFQFGCAAYLGSGKQFMPWIHLDDMVKLLIHSITNTDLEGIYNGVAPDKVSHSQFMNTIAELLEKKIWLPSIPVWVLKIIFGELSLTLTTGSSVSAKKLLDTGFKFNYPNLRSAIHKELNQ